MKKRYIGIFSLVLLSLLGIVYLQVQWIQGAMKLKREQYDNDIYISLQNIKDSIVNRKNKETFGLTLNFQTQHFGNFIPTTTVMANYQVKALIRKELVKHKIKQPFEYCITNESFQPTLFSTGFKPEYLDAENNYQTGLSDGSFLNSETLNLYLVEPENYFKHHLATLLLFAALFTSVIIAAFVLTIRTLFTQERLSEIKSDFINNMTHEFKTPIATIQLASEALTNPRVIGNAEQIQYYSGMIREENRRMNQQVEKILQAAQLEKEEIRMQWKTIHVHDILKKVAENTRLNMEENRVQFSMELNAQNDTIDADEVHFTSIIINLLDNAVKYSKENPTVMVKTRSVKNKLQIQFIDNGIGMDAETQKHIYEKFFRAHTGNLHNVKGFGLGLTYVKNIVDAHRGQIEVQSELGKGTTFTLSFQLKNA
ncbi:MAG: sensor histidine kinase [Chitinophagaceae bacterium]